MTSSKSLFNFGIYKNTLKRFKWGSLLYFIILFFSVPFIFLVQDKEYLLTSYRLVIESTPLILRSGFIAIPILLAMIVPTIVAVLCFNNVHSAKQGIFVHSLPVTRLANYISTLLAAFTLIVVPIMLNTIVLLIMSMTGYQALFSSGSVVYWFLLNVAISFIMFSVATFAAYLTGNTAAHIAINVLIHTTPLIIALGIYLISNIFLYGFSESENFIASKIANNTPIVWLYSQSMSYSAEAPNIFLSFEMWTFTAVAVIFYILAFILYRNRKIEACGDVAAFKVFRPILKYTATVFSAVLFFGIITPSVLDAAAIFTIATALTAIVYFSSEMLIKKTVKVFSSYKGYVGFAIFMAIFIAVFAYTDIFGYERRIPKSSDIESASVYYTYGKNIPMIDDNKLIENVRSIHSQLIDDIPITTKNIDAPYLLSVRYKLKNGNVLAREYHVSQEIYNHAISEMYESAEYKNKIYSFDVLNVENVKDADLRVSTSMFNYHIAINEDSACILEAIKKDLAELSYEQIESQQFAIHISVYVNQTAQDNYKSKVFDSSVYTNEYPNEIYTFDMDINSNFVNTFAAFKELGYYDKIISKVCENIKICTIPVYVKDEIYTFKSDTGNSYEFNVNTNDCISVNLQDAAKLTQQLIEHDSGYEQTSSLPDGKFYLIYNYTGDYDIIDLNSHVVAFSAEDLPEYLKKYVNE